ncbi:lytic transglycosylase domain-containing protein [Phenylobacterium aquaticum]|uniref:lytic transglycosylase domain-containing protein n=1 Tax=Phenylobacterium aquaticum TaxID=1763816 RepID=UPI001F5C72EE|nr:lytic transglycosylase domain-containing protein [Phenylobacterium aquaticum]MCI3135543.1 lytic transglycosylase domain-containing protein [Phenylobacterium aquaticum]
MTASWRIRIVALAMICTGFSGAAVAATPQVLSPADAQHYAAAFESVDRGDYIDAAMQGIEITDPTLNGYITYRQLMHPTAHKSNFDELADWLSRYSDLPPAERISGLAAKRKPVEAPPLPTPRLAGTDWAQVQLVAPGSGGPFDLDNTRLAREAFYSGDPKRAYDVGKAVGDRWIVGMAAYRLRKFDQAEKALAQLADDQGEDLWVRAGGAYWAARAAQAQGHTDDAVAHLRLAAGAPNTFYGMIAARQVALHELGDPIPMIESPTAPPRAAVLVKASYSGPSADLTRMMAEDPRAHRAAALAQIGRVLEAAQELRAGVALASTNAERDRWTRLAALINAGLAEDMATASYATARRRAEADYPVPALKPREGFKVNKALVYAIVRQESRFNPGVVSPAGAVGLMQLMPDAAAHVSGDTRLRDDMSPLFDPSYNLKVGQDYLSWLMSQGVGYDILRTVAAYNGGPATLQKTAEMLGDDDESLMVIECMPALETRNYVEKVMAAYWSYRKKFGQESVTLDALASGERYADIRLDAEPPPVVEKVRETKKSKASKSTKRGRKA